jgi:16S rRNA (cytidine1402-2'-O)-methyltransferase
MAIGKLYLIPNLIGDTSIDLVIPSSIAMNVLHINCYIVENIRNARRYLKKLNPDIIIDNLQFFELNKHTSNIDIYGYLSECEKGSDMALLSDAGLPCIADPGNVIVKMAHEKNIKVVPFAGPSSIFMALMASGLNGQNFAFNGYVPIDKTERIAKLKALENKSQKEKQSQIFMDTPYRNNKLFEEITSTLNSNTYLCVAANISNADEFIATKKISEWKNFIIDLNKKPCIFII